MTRKLVIDTDTAGDDTQALLMAALADSVDLEALTVVAGNVEFDYEVENAKYTLDMAGVADEVPVYEGSRSPLVKEFDHVDHVHGEGGLGGELFPETGIDSADGHAVDAIVAAARESPGEVTLACIGPLTNVALALRREPDLNDLLDEVWVMGGALATLGNDTPAAEFNFWVDPDAAKVVLNELDVTLVDWGLTLRQGTIGGARLDEFTEADTPYADFCAEITSHARAFSEERFGTDAATFPDTLTLACLVNPDLVEEAETYFVDVDEREGMTRGYSLIDELGITDGEPRTRVVESVDEAAFERMVGDMLVHADPERSV
ncbi:nucleoside hydrolase [Candidatus Halobonum tyrrellensis]|uniref:Inosine-uridine nucleoside N-ribohydrolase n=1 Tax=Candidatus Halobonum tyrrellensis G22 TaxID=1324957 RepID=V4HBJ7_9EURY|nr:nucleoside hydrolase [Candidatus Halobonum tyrrellensis]ESP87418.1 Inosine-uridine nucleoside N-ribohydrolase [Candidatus Halobonum tyrrellensis G22]